VTTTLRLPAPEKQRLAAEIARRLGMKASRDEPLAPHTTMRVGGPADLFVEAHNLFELRGIVRYARTHDLPLFLVGRGSDLVISDAGIGGLVVLVRALGQRIEGRRLVAEAGLPMAKVATLAREAGLSGLEFGLAIPGTVGGAVWANAGAHGSDMRGVLVEAQVVTADGSEARLGPDELGMAYRETRLKHADAGRPEVVVAATFELVAADPGVIAERLDDIRRWRQAHQPIGQKSAGSVFRNPEADSAGRIIDELGLKGTQVGGAMVSPKHANFIVNTGPATASDVWRLAELVRQRVLEERGIELRYEVEFVGDWSERAGDQPADTAADGAAAATHPAAAGPDQVTGVADGPTREGP
jgi:UDP-N-acetylmuramate dehydrogenase